MEIVGGAIFFTTNFTKRLRGRNFFCELEMLL